MQQRWCNRIKDSEKISDAYEYNLQKCGNFLLAAHKELFWGSGEGKGSHALDGLSLTAWKLFYPHASSSLK